MKILEKILPKTWKKRILAVSAGALLLLSAAVPEKGGAFSAMGDNARAEDGKICVVIDPGHGGSNLR